jgi:hypothetical protein
MCRDKLREGFCNYTIDNILINMIEKSFNEVFEEIEIEEETMIEFEIAKSSQNCNCRICGKLLPKNITYMIRVEPHRSKAGIFICDECVTDMYERMGFVKKQEEKDRMEHSICIVCGNKGFSYIADYSNGNEDTTSCYKCNECGCEIS